MPLKLADKEIAALVGEVKPLPPDFLARIRVKPKRGHKEKEMDLQGKDGSLFRLILRQSNFNPLDFSVILAHCPPNSNQIFRLCRYNGRSHEHTNDLEGQTFYQFHIHRATARYQDLGAREDTFLSPNPATDSPIFTRPCAAYSKTATLSCRPKRKGGCLRRFEHAA